MHSLHTSRIPRTLLCGILFCCVSCGTNEVVTQIPEDHSRLKAIATVYAYACRNLGHPPKSPDELKPTFAKAGVKNTEKLFSSTRDGKPYVIVWGVDLEQQYRGSELLLAYESTGADGHRLAITCNHSLVEIEDEKFKNLEWPAGHQPEHKNR